MTEEEAKEILALPMKPNDAAADTIRDYMKTLLVQLLTELDGFSGKRPFGNSGWEYDLFAALISGGKIEGRLDQDGFVAKVDNRKAQAMILEATRWL